MASIEQLYKDFGVLADAKDKAGEHEDEFKSIISGVKGGANEKRLASQFISRFYKYFPGLAESALDAVFDLCEDEDVNIRKQAIKDLPSLCKETPDTLQRIADVLTQLLQSDDATELSLIQSSLMSLLKANPKATLGGLYTQILEGEELVRDRAIKFLSTKVPLLGEEVLTKEVEDYIVTETTKVMGDVTGDEFITFVKMLQQLKSMQTLLGRQQLLDIVTDQADLDSKFEPADTDCVDRLIQCVRQALPMFSKNVHATKFVAYMCVNVIPVLSEVTSPVDEEADEATPAVDVQLELLKLFAEMSQYCPDIESPEEHTSRIFDRLLDYMPLPPQEEETENTDTENSEPKLQFSYVECLMFAFHQLARRSPEFLTSEDSADRLKDFRIRLQLFARGVQVYIKQLRVALQGKTGDALKTSENKIKVVALKITSNINTLIKDLFHNPPSYKAAVGLSFKPKVQAADATSPGIAGQKRQGIKPITFESDAAKRSKQDPKTARQLYSPPSGKFSERAGTYSDIRGSFRGGRGRGRGRGRGSFRGRGFKRY